MAFNSMKPIATA